MNPLQFASFLAYTNEVISRYSVEELVNIWKLSTTFHAQGKVIRALLNKQIPVLARHHRIPITKETNFASFVSDYEKLTFDRLCDQNVNTCLKQAIRENKRWKVEQASSRGADIDDGLYEAAKEGNLDLVQFFIEKGARGLEYALYVAAKKNRMEVIEFLLKIQSEIAFHNYGLAGAAFTGNLDLMHYFLDQGADDLAFAMGNAVYGNQQEAVELLVEIDPKLVNVGLVAAIEKDNQDMIDYFIAKGAVDWPSALTTASGTNNKRLVNFFLGKGVSKEHLRKAVDETRGWDHEEMTAYLETVMDEM